MLVPETRESDLATAPPDGSLGATDAAEANEPIDGTTAHSASRVNERDDETSMVDLRGHTRRDFGGVRRKEMVGSDPSLPSRMAFRRVTRFGRIQSRKAA
jgi:hypothetical protein